MPPIKRTARCSRSASTCSSKCWTEDSVVLNSATYQAPFPHGGVEGYPAWRTAETAGAIGETDGKGRIMRACVVPKPYQKPHPAVMVPTTKSIESIEFCAKRGFIPVHFTPLTGVTEAARAYNDIAARQGVYVKLGAMPLSAYRNNQGRL